MWCGGGGGTEQDEEEETQRRREPEKRRPGRHARFEEAVVWRWQRKLVMEVDPGKKKRDRDARRRRRRIEEEEDDGMYREARWWFASEDCKMKRAMKMVVERRLHRFS
ncbi:hypothetical protein HA466_0252390 [Hirschfeldia incana]|nr:hypothetical protein HA466_0252390 [Hirschfeldia incana]